MSVTRISKGCFLIIQGSFQINMKIAMIGEESKLYDQDNKKNRNIKDSKLVKISKKNEGKLAF